MSREIQVPTVTGLTLYAVALNATGAVFNGTTFEAIEADNWATYDIALAEADGTGLYLGDFPAVAAGVYGVLVYRRVGGTPTITDPVIAAGDMPWTGTVREPVQTGDIFARVGADGAGLTALATSANLATLTGYVDTEVAALVTRLNLLALDGSGRVTIAPAGADTITIETGLNLRQAVAIIAAATAGVSTGGDTGAPVVFKAAGLPGTTRITATADSGNRSTVTLIPPG